MTEHQKLIRKGSFGLSKLGSLAEQKMNQVTHQSPIKRLEIYQVVDYVLCKSVLLLIFDAQSPIKRFGIYQVDLFVLYQSEFSFLMLNHQLKYLELTSKSWNL